MKPARILTIAGSDSGGGAGIEADLKTIERLGGYGMAAITAVTAQNTLGVFGIWPLPPAAVRQQIEVVATDIGLDAAKTGMLGSAAMVHEVAETLRRLAPLPLVVDPVMVAKGGARLLEAEAGEILRRELLPLASLITPNLPEAEVLTGQPAQTRRERELASRRLVEMGAKAVLIKGGHGEGEVVEDLLFDGEQFSAFSAARLPTKHTHGTGCTLSAAIATGLGQGMTCQEAVERAIRYVQTAIRFAPGFGHGHGPVSHAAGGAPWT
ncbi:MAG: bifunctional hydroxymethylpyrimidine kinase/phosphomethylpyrimidine kinase [Thermoleophilia bacterium]